MVVVLDGGLCFQIRVDRSTIGLDRSRCVERVAACVDVDTNRIPCVDLPRQLDPLFVEHSFGLTKL
jgi:hypothetical protein